MSDPAHDLPDDDRRPSRPAPDGTNPEWLVSSDQGAEDERQAHSGGEGPDGMRLTTSHDLSTSVPVERPRVPERPAQGARPEERSKGPKTWSAAASSVPKLKMTAAASPGPVMRQSVGPREAPAELRVMEPLDVDAEPADDAAFPEDTGPLGPAPPPPPRRLEEPLWVIAVDAVRSDRRVQLLVALVLVLPIVAWIFWPRSEPGVSLHALRGDPGRWDGQMVRINGRVGEVFHVGAGWAFNLHQGRDTIVVFTRGRAPRSRDNISIAGSVSTGYLDGQPRQAIFAEPESP